MNNLVSLSNPKLPITLKYPDPTPLGCPVSVNERANEIGYRVHLISEGSDEIYFEVGQYATLSISEAMALFKKEAAERISDLEIRETQEITFASRKGYRFSIRWPGKERVITYIEEGEMVYRIIYDPASPLNEQILATFAFQQAA